MKFIFDLISAWLPSVFGPVVKFIKLEMISVYIKGVDALRRMFILNIIAKFLALFVVAGFVMIHIAVFMLMPWDTKTNSIVLLSLGCFYFIVPTLFIIRICSRRMWLRVSGAEAMHRKVSGED